MLNWYHYVKIKMIWVVHVRMSPVSLLFSNYFCKCYMLYTFIIIVDKNEKWFSSWLNLKLTRNVWRWNITNSNILIHEQSDFRSKWQLFKCKIFFKDTIQLNVFNKKIWKIIKDKYKCDNYYNHDNEKYWWKYLI